MESDPKACLSGSWGNWNWLGFGFGLVRTWRVARGGGGGGERRTEKFVAHVAAQHIQIFGSSIKRCRPKQPTIISPQAFRESAPSSSPSLQPIKHALCFAGGGKVCSEAWKLLKENLSMRGCVCVCGFFKWICMGVAGGAHGAGKTLGKSKFKSFCLPTCPSVSCVRLKDMSSAHF